MLKSISKIKRLAALHVPDRTPSISSLAKIIRIAKTTVVKYRGFIKASGYSFSDFAALSPEEMDAILDQRSMRHRQPPSNGFIERAQSTSATSTPTRERTSDKTLALIRQLFC